ncbi:MAG: hypothetical protein HY657_14310 [Acidobacteria bacterium]|nr:hypothetical protein [Acidobacteriota bacterium]
MALWLVAALGTSASAALDVEVLRATGGLPPHIVGQFEEPLAFQQRRGGPYYVFDRRGHTVYTVDAAKDAARKIVEIGQEQGRVLQPRGFDTNPYGWFVVADAPGGLQRVQIFGPGGVFVRAFRLPDPLAPSITVGTLVLSGLGSIQYPGENLLIGHPESGTLFAEYSEAGVALRGIGRLRPTGFEGDRDVHLALNAGLPLADPTGGYYYVFLGGRPMFRKYAADGRLLFERHIEGPELDETIAVLPTVWPRRRVEDRELPFVQPTVRAAAVDERGRLWVSLSVPFTYVYDARGEKIRTVQFRAAGLVNPTSLFFPGDGRLLVTPGCYEFDSR